MDRKQQASSDRRTASIGRMLEPLNWRTTQRESNSGYEHNKSAGKWGLILAAIIIYQDRNRGFSPPDVTICRDTGLSIGVVRYHMRAMERRGLLKDEKGFPRHIQLLDGAKITSPSVGKAEVLTEEDKVDIATVTDSTAVTQRAKKRTFMFAAKEIGQAIMDHYDEIGEPPGIGDIKRRTGQSFSGGTSNIIRKMVELGWVFHEPRHHRDLALTGHGRAALFGQMDGRDLHTNIPVRRAPDEPEAVEAPRPVRRQAPSPMSPQPMTALGVMREQMDKGGPELAPQPTTGIKGMSDVDLIIELTRRGFKVSR